MTNTFKQYKLKDCCLSILDGDHLAPPKTVSGIPFITISNITPSNQIDFSDTSFVSQEYYDKLDRVRRAQANDILYSVVGSFGKPVFVKGNKPFVFQRHIAILRANDKVVKPEYLYYVMRTRSFYMQADMLAVGAAQRTISLSSLRNMDVSLPSLSIQHRIASILSAYDSLIENNSTRIRLLEKMAENLYKEWFVRFRFPGHEKVEMENGLPKGWKIKKYEDELIVKYGKGLPTDRLTVEGYPVFGSNGQIGFYTSYMYETPQILISCRGASSGVVNISLPKSFITNNSLICELSDKTESVFEYLKYYFLNTNLVQYQTGSAQPQITINNIIKLNLLVPSLQVQRKFAKIIKNIDNEMNNLQHQNLLLARQRDLLLPRLMSGKLEVQP